MSYNVSSRYKQVIYSGDAQHKLKILFNNVELQDADRYCEKLTIKSRIMPNGAKRIELSSFVSKEAEIIFHDIDTSIIQDQVSISIGTLVDNAYEYVPIGIFNIQDKPTTDKDKTTIKLRDNSVKFDFNYDAKPLIDQHGGSATKLQILQDICSKAGVTWVISSFIGSSDLVGIYDNTITARQYVAYIAEQAGRIATINRNGELAFININAANTQAIPIDIVEKYEAGKPYRIGKIVYEDAIRKYETESTQFDTLYLDSANPYVSSQEQVNSIYQQLNGFKIDSYKTGKILGNPAIDPFDKIQVHVVTRNLFNKDLFGEFSVGLQYLNIQLEPNTTYTISSNIPISSNSNLPNLYAMPSNKQPNPTKYGVRPNSSVTMTTLEDGIVKIGYSDSANEFEDEKNTFWYQIEKGTYATQYVPYKDETYTTLATNDLVYNGALIQTFDTQIGEEERKENVTITGQATFKKWARTEIDNVNAEILIQTGRIDNVEKEINPTDTANGTSFYLEDSTDADLVNFEMEGKTTQATRSGINLLNPAKFVTSTYIQTINTITNEISISSNSYANFVTIFNNLSLAQGNYTIWCEVLSGTFTGGNLCYYDNNNTKYSSEFNFRISTSHIHQLNASAGLNQLRIYAPTCSSNVVLKIWLVSGTYSSSTMPSYEPYGAMPSPDYPSELVSVGTYNNETGKYEIKIITHGTNYFDASKITNTNIVVSDNGKTIKMPIVASGNGITSVGILKNLAPNLKVGDTIYVRFTRSGGSGSDYNQFIFLSGSNTLVYAYNSSPSVILTQEDLNGIVYFYANRASSGETTQITLIDFRIIKQQDVEYEPYKGNTFLYTLNEPLRAIGDTKDLLYIKNGYLYVERKIGSVVLNGSESNWYMSNDGTKYAYWRYGNQIPNYKEERLPKYSNYFNYENANWRDANSPCIAENTNSGNLLLFRIDDITSLNGWKTWLSTHNTEVNYILANSYIEELGQVNYPTTYKPITYIETTDELQPNMAITYVMDTQLTNYVEEHVAQIKVNEDSITSRVETIESSDYDSRINAVEQRQTDSELAIDVISTNIDKRTGQIREVTTTTGFTFNAEGLTISDSSSKFSALHRNDGTFYKDGDTTVGQYTKDGSKQKDLYLFGVYYYGMEDINSTPRFIAQLYNDGNEDGVGHFWNEG